ncbi:MAG: Na+/H+ antiporter NhaC family protein, partial [Candidatus Saliniplasma sp.]
YGPMLEAEYRARKTGKVVADDAKPMLETESTLGEVSEDITGRAWVFVASILTLVAVSIVGIWTSGGGMDYYAEEGLMGVFGNAAVVQSLLYASFAMLVVATVAAFGYRQLNIEEWIGSIENGFKIMLKPVLILLLAWTIGTATSEVGTAEYVVGLAEAAGIGALLVPLIVFVISAFIAFTTGTSWGTFGIMIPMAIPMAYSLSGDVVGVAVWASIASVFSGGIMGDHCSPISDTTIMSSMFTGSDHVDHVNTQIPYALTVAGAAIVSLSLLAAGLTMWYILLPVSWIVIVVAFFFLSNWYGKKLGIPGGKVPIYYGPDDELKDDPTAEHEEEVFDFKGEETEEEGFVDELAEEEQEMMEDSEEPEP